MSPEFVANPRPASTVIVLRDTSGGPEVFLVRRHEETPFMGGAHVFPGGRVDVSDRRADDTWCDGIAHAARQLSDLPAIDAVAFHVAAARELFEEAGVLLGRTASGHFVSCAGADDHARFKQYRGDVHRGTATLRAVLERERLRLALDALVLFAHWVTPPIDARQFDTRFFVTRVPPEQTPAHDEAETTHGTWVTPATAIGQAIAGDILLPPPTWTTLRELQPFSSVDEAIAWARQRRIIRRQPALVEEGGRRMLLLPGDPDHPDSAGVRASDVPIETRFVFVDRRWRAECART